MRITWREIDFKPNLFQFMMRRQLATDIYYTHIWSLKCSHKLNNHIVMFEIARNRRIYTLED